MTRAQLRAELKHRAAMLESLVRVLTIARDRAQSRHAAGTLGVDRFQEMIETVEARAAADAELRATYGFILELGALE